MISCTMCPKLDAERPLLLRALMIISESPSIINLLKPRSFAKQRAPRAANTSTISTDVGSGMCCLKAAITKPMSLRIIAPKPAELESTNVAPSKLTFTQFDGGGNHFVTFG